MRACDLVGSNWIFQDCPHAATAFIADCNWVEESWMSPKQVTHLKRVVSSA